MSKGIQILSSTKISLPLLPNNPPPVKLSLFDAFWISLKPVQKVLIYSNINTNVAFSTILENLKSSLSSVLVKFLPLAGKLTYVPATGDVEIDLSDLSYIFVEAESDLDLHQLATDQVINVESFSKLVPAIDVAILPFHVLAVQVTRFNCGGVVIGYSIHHIVADGNAATKFVEAWSMACKAKMNGIELSIEPCNGLSYDRAVIKHPKGDEIARGLLRNSAPDLPSTKHPRFTSIQEKRNQLSRRTFIIDAPSIQFLKQKSTPEISNASKAQVPSTFSAISAHIWSCVARSKSFDPDEETMFGITMDCRTRLNPPIPEGYIGNCIRGVMVKMLVRELTENDGLIRACKAIRESINNVAKDPLGDCEEWLNAFHSLPLDKLVHASSSPKFKVYDNDFGWGIPDRFEMVSMNSDGEFALVAGKEEGSVQMTISINPENLEAFYQLFLAGLSE